MIQRVQTLYLLGIIVAQVILLIFPFTGSTYFTTQDGFNIMDVLQMPATYIFLSIIFAAIAIFLFKKRKVQLRFTWLTFFSILVLIAVMVNICWPAVATSGISVLNISVICPVVSIIFSLLAIRGIKKDEALIKSLNSLR